MKKVNNFKTVRIQGDDRIKAADEVVEFIEETEGRNSNYTDMLHWFLRKFKEDKIR